MSRQKTNPYLNSIIRLLVFTAVLLFVIICFIRLAQKTDFFRVKEVLIRDANAAYPTPNLGYLIGRSIIGIDLKKEGYVISESFPAYKKANLVRIMPDKLCVIFTARSPAAYLKLQRYFYIDEEAMLFEPAGSEIPADLPLIVGVEVKDLASLQGKRHKIYPAGDIGIGFRAPGIVTALTIIKAVKDNRALRDISVKKIDVADPINSSFFIVVNPAGMILQVKIGQDYIPDKINILTGVLAQLGNDLNKIDYVDLRFKQPVIKLKEGEER